MIATVSFAQGSLLATLSHEGQISAYYGASALGQALESADNGDVITLSSGQFNAANITKAVTLRGAGMSVSTDSLNSHEATIIQGGFNIQIADSLTGRLTMEGLYCNGSMGLTGNLKNAQFLKCRFRGFWPDYNNGTKLTNVTFIHCRLSRHCMIPANSNAYFINCVINSLMSTFSSSSVELDNCILKFNSTNWTDYGMNNPNSLKNAYLKNSIVAAYYYSSSSYIDGSCVAYNCIGLSQYDLFKNMAAKNNTNTWLSNASILFKTYTSYNNTDEFLADSETFELTDDAKTKYLGTDGTQVGLYGGNLVYDENPTTPQITKCNVASKSTADGKLSVDIEVKAAEY